MPFELSGLKYRKMCFSFMSAIKRRSFQVHERSVSHPLDTKRCINNLIFMFSHHLIVNHNLPSEMVTGNRLPRLCKTLVSDISFSG